MGKYTPEPWHLGCVGLRHPAGGWFTTIIVLGKTKMLYPAVCTADTTEESEANARRIVTCVNACEGINPEAVPDLLKALQLARTLLVREGYSTGLRSPDFDSISAAIAKAEESQK